MSSLFINKNIFNISIVGEESYRSVLINVDLDLEFRDSVNFTLGKDSGFFHKDIEVTPLTYLMTYILTTREYNAVFAPFSLEKSIDYCYNKL